jgi:predicted aconitase with swiveling domain
MTVTQKEFTAIILLPGHGQGEALVLPEPLSLWGGLNPETGEIIDRRHACSGAIVTGRVLVLPAGRGSSSASSVLLEAVRAGTAPAAIITAEADAILALGAAVAREMYGTSLPVVVLNTADYEHLQDGHFITVTEDGVVTVKGAVAGLSE